MFSIRKVCPSDRNAIWVEVSLMGPAAHLLPAPGMMSVEEVVCVEPSLVY